MDEKHSMPPEAAANGQEFQPHPLADAPAPQPHVRGLMTIEEYVDGYSFRADEGDYTPNENDKAMLIDALYGAVEEVNADFVFASRHNDTAGECQPVELDSPAIRRLREKVAATTPQAHLRVEPDYCFDPDNWEFTCDWTDRDQVHGHGDGLNRSDPMRVCTLIKGPDKWVADVPVTWDEHGDPDETEVKWFDSEAEARASLAAEGPQQ